MDWETLNYKPLYVLLADHLQLKIEEGYFPANSYLPPLRILMSSFNVSQVTVRKALTLLEKKKLVKIVQGSGIRVTASGPAPKSLNSSASLDITKDINDLFKLRSILETATLRESFTAIDSNALYSLKKQFDKKPSLQTLYKLDEGLHHEIVSKCDNLPLKNALSDVMRKLTLYREINFRSQPNKAFLDKKNILSIYKGITTNDLEKTCDSLNRHINSTRKTLLEYIKENQ